MNQWFHRHAWRNHAAGLSRTNVVCDPATGSISGFVSMCAAQVERSYLPSADQRNRPEAIPAILLARLVVDLACQQRGYARSLMIFALRTALVASEGIGCFCVLAHPLNDGVREFYRHFGFEDLPFDPGRSMAVRIVDLAHNGFAGSVSS